MPLEMKMRFLLFGLMASKCVFFTEINSDKSNYNRVQDFLPISILV